MKNINQYLMEKFKLNSKNSGFESLPEDIKQSCKELTNVAKQTIFKGLKFEESDFRKNEVYFIDDKFVGTFESINDFWSHRNDKIKYLESISTQVTVQLRLNCQGLDEQPFINVVFAPKNGEKISTISVSEEIKYLLLHENNK